MGHPNQNHKYIMETYRQYLLGCKKRFGTARSQVHYRELIMAYLEAKREVVIKCMPVQK